MNTNKLDSGLDNTVEKRILEAATKIFTDKGYETTSMNEIAVEAGVARTALNYYYRSKLLLFEAVILNFADKLLPNIADAISKEGTILDKVPLIVGVYTSLLRENINMPHFMINEIRRDKSFLFRILSSDKDRLTTVFMLKQQLIEDMESGVIRKMPIIDIISTFIGLVVTQFILWDTFETYFIDQTSDSFDAFVDRREVEVSKMIVNFLQPTK